MSEFETLAGGRREFLQTVFAAPALAAALVDTAQAQAPPAPIDPVSGEPTAGGPGRPPGAPSPQPRPEPQPPGGPAKKTAKKAAAKKPGDK